MLTRKRHFVSGLGRAGLREFTDFFTVVRLLGALHAGVHRALRMQDRSLHSSSPQIEGHSHLQTLPLPGHVTLSRPLIDSEPVSETKLRRVVLRQKQANVYLAQYYAQKALTKTAATVTYDYCQ